MSILTGARRTWNPLGGGGLTTTSLGGGSFGASFGGSFFISTNWIFSAFAFSSLTPARAVAYTAPPIRTVWSTMLNIVPPAIFCLCALDSSSWLNIPHPMEVRGRKVRAT